MRHVHTFDPVVSLHMNSLGTIHPGIIQEAVDQLDTHPELWNEYKWRTTGNSPHREADDIWVRYNPVVNFDLANPAKFNEEHTAEWYPCADKLPSIKEITEQVTESLGAEKLGAVLITRVPPGKQIHWHQDGGWHAKVHRKFLVLLRGNLDQSFEFENEQMFAEPGDCFEFQNEYLHSVNNPTDQERISLIICLRGFKNNELSSYN